jgi:hypothetical protein
MEFKNWAWIGGDLSAGVAWMLENGASIAGRVSAAQDYIASTYSPESIASQWEQIFEKT